MVAQRMVWLDGLRLTAGLSMVVLHASADSNGLPWIQAEMMDRIPPILVRTLVYCARTELFIIISLFLLLRSLDLRPRNYRETVTEQARKLLIPFLIWTIFFSGYNLIKADAFGYYDSALAEVTNPVSWLSYIFLGAVKYHMHFVPTLFAIILLHPIYRLSVRMPVLGLGVLFCLMVKWSLDDFVYAQLWGNPVLPWLVRLIKVLTYIGYGLVAGSLVALLERARGVNLAQFLPVILFGGVLLFAVKLTGIWYTIHDGAWPFSYLPLFWADFLMPAVLFVAAMAMADRHWPDILSRLAPYSFGIYLSHPIFLDLAEVFLRDVTAKPIVLVLGKAGFALFCAASLTFAISKTPALAWTVGLGPLPVRRPTAARNVVR
jgi:surface polysaccharide O-acyltransferase-like enzyme